MIGVFFLLFASIALGQKCPATSATPQVSASMPAASARTASSTISRTGGWMRQSKLDSIASSWKGELDSMDSRVKLAGFSIVLKTDDSSRPTLFNNLGQAFNYGRQKGLGFILRFYYESGEPTMDILKSQVPPIAKFLSQHTDVIYLVQAGFLGVNWGEFWGGPLSPENDKGKNAVVRQAKTFIVDSFLNANLTVAMRTPRDVALYYNGNPRVTLHNDCILGDGPNGADMGTFDKGSHLWNDGNVNAAKQYSISLNGPKGGEGCLGSYSTSCTDLVQYIQTFKLSYLNYVYPPAINDLFKGSCYQQVQDALAQNKF